ncbi:hypothetical protein PCANC_15054 [Puccinia coronata f. sp. avenae]|uniref:Chromo domain-containing protein n=1 Tax=Puccinia coronata f. sp. avenae TaxID=200324 RepID=A0A2N5UAF0_9BASI|nr:hypothetical protein PCANC_15054 [Puccinia coronata f. sp. avenae]
MEAVPDVAESRVPATFRQAQKSERSKDWMGIQDNVKEKYYSDGDIVDWSKLKAVLDVRTVKKDKYEYLISWTGLTVGNDTWVAQNHIPGCLDDYLKQFRETHKQQYVKASKK